MNIQFNQKLWSRKYGWGKVVDIDECGDKYNYSPIAVQFNGFVRYYNYNGQEDLSYDYLTGKHIENKERFPENQDLFSNEIKNQNNEMSYEKCYKCEHSQSWYRVNNDGGYLEIECLITRKNIKITGCQK